MERALEKAGSKVWAAQIRARGLGEDGRGHPRHRSAARVDRSCLLMGTCKPGAAGSTLRLS